MLSWKSFAHLIYWAGCIAFFLGAIDSEQFIKCLLLVFYRRDDVRSQCSCSVSPIRNAAKESAGLGHFLKSWTQGACDEMLGRSCLTKVELEAHATGLGIAWN